MKKTVALSALAVAALAGSAFGVVTGNVEYRFVTIPGTGALPNQGTGLADGTVLGPNTVIAANAALMRQRIALQVRVTNIGGTFSTQQFNATNTALQLGVSSPASNFGIFGSIGNINLGDGTLAGQSLGFAPWGSTQPGVVAGSSWANFQGAAFAGGTLAPAAWNFNSPTPPPINNAGTNVIGNDGSWVEVSRFRWESSDVTPRTIGGAFENIATSVRVGNGVAAASFPNADEELNGSVTYSIATVIAGTPMGDGSGIQVGINNFSFLIQGQTNTAPDSLSTPAVITADPFVNPDALNLVLASFTDDDNDNISVNITNDGGIGALGGSVSVVGNGTGAPTIVLNWDAPNAAIGQTFTIDFNYTDGVIGTPLTGQTSVTVIPAPGALALLGLGGLVAARRRRA